MQKLRLLLILLASISLLALINSRNESSHREKIKISFLMDLQKLKGDVYALGDAAAKGNVHPLLLDKFKTVRLAFKKIEGFLAYYNNTCYNQLNRSTDKSHGLQLLERLLHENLSAEKLSEISDECHDISQLLSKIIADEKRFTFHDKEIMESLQQEIIRINSLGLSGQDSQVMNYSLAESQSALTAMAKHLELMDGAIKDEAQQKELDKLIVEVKSCAKLLEQSEFNSFNRINFIREHLNPVFRQLIKLQSALGIETYC